MTARWKWIDLLLAVALAWGAWAFVAEVRAAAARAIIFQARQPEPDVTASATVTAVPSLRSADYSSVWGQLFGSRLQAPDPRPPAGGPSMDAGLDLPLLYGVADLGNGPAALLATGAGQRAQWTSPGQEIGGYRLQSIDQTKLVFTRGEMRFEASPSELRKSRRRPAAARTLQAPAHRAVREAQGSVATARRLPSGSGRFNIGAEFRPGRFAADAADGAADGIVYRGYVRRVRQTPFGSQHWWERADEE